MISRCTCPSMVNYDEYGGRGITVCDRWRTFDNFYADMGNRPSSKHSLDRKDPDGNYEPDNCRWATTTQQACNKRTSKLLTFQGETLTVTEWARKIGVGKATLAKRLANGWPLERALTEGPNPAFQR
jgi:hypothetical protein